MGILSRRWAISASWAPFAPEAPLPIIAERLPADALPAPLTPDISPWLSARELSAEALGNAILDALGPWSFGCPSFIILLRPCFGSINFRAWWPSRAALFLSSETFLGDSCSSLYKSLSRLGGSNSGNGLKNSSRCSTRSCTFCCQYWASPPSLDSTSSIWRYLHSSSNLHRRTSSKCGPLMNSANLMLIL